MEEQRSNLTGCECKVFSATKAKEREGLGDEYNRWYKGAGKPEIETVQVRQSSDNEFHCLTFVVWYRRGAR